MANLIYLSSPFTHKDPKITKERVKQTTEVVAKLIAEGNIVISPIIYSESFSDRYKLSKDPEFWKNFAHVILKKCDEMKVLMLDDWNKSDGVLYEISLAKELGIKVTLLPH